MPKFSCDGYYIMNWKVFFQLKNMDFKLFVRHKGFHIIFYKGYLKKALLFHLIVDVNETIEKEEIAKD